MLKEMVIAWDLDGTLIDSTHRCKYSENGFDLDYWRSNCTREMIMKDSLLPLAQLFYEYQKTGFTQICVTARVLNEFDLEFFKYHNLNFDEILHRQDSLELDEVLKSKKIQELLNGDKHFPFQAFDDKQENLEIFDSFGFRTFHATYMNEKLKAKKYSEFDLTPGNFVKKD